MKDVFNGTIGTEQQFGENNFNLCEQRNTYFIFATKRYDIKQD